MQTSEWLSFGAAAASAVATFLAAQAAYWQLQAMRRQGDYDLLERRNALFHELDQHVEYTLNGSADDFNDERSHKLSQLHERIANYFDPEIADWVVDTLDVAMTRLAVATLKLNDAVNDQDKPLIAALSKERNEAWEALWKLQMEKLVGVFAPFTQVHRINARHSKGLLAAMWAKVSGDST